MTDATTTGTDLATIQPWDAQKRAVIKGLIVRGKPDAPPVTDAELVVYEEVSRALQLDPLKGEIIFPNFGDGRQPYPTWKGRLKLASTNTTVVRVDGPYFTTDGKEWTDTWLSDDHPAAAMVELYLRDNPAPIRATATWSTWAQYKEVDEEIEADGEMPLLEWQEDRTRAKVKDRRTGAMRYPRHQVPVIKGGKPVMVPKRVKTGKKVLELVGWWAKGSGEYMLGKKALNLGAELAARLFGDVSAVAEQLTTTDGGPELQHRRMWGLVGEIEDLLSDEQAKRVKLTDEQRHKISGVDTWQDLDMDSQVEVIHRLERFLQRLQDKALGIEEAELVDDPDVDPFEGVVDPAPGPSKAPKATPKTERVVRQETRVTGQKDGWVTRETVGPPIEEDFLPADAVEPEVVEESELTPDTVVAIDPQALEEWGEAYSAEADEEPEVEAEAGVEDPPPDPEADEVESLASPGGPICGEDRNGDVCTLRPGHAPVPHNWGSETPPAEATTEQLAELTRLGHTLGKALPTDQPLSKTKAENLLTLWARQVQTLQGGTSNQEKLI